MFLLQYVHYAIDEDDQRAHMRRQHREAMSTRAKNSAAMLVSDSKNLSMTTPNLTPPQWIQCDMLVHFTRHSVLYESYKYFNTFVVKQETCRNIYSSFLVII